MIPARYSQDTHQVSRGRKKKVRKNKGISENETATRAPAGASSKCFIF
jgi:hypothetical protein